MRFAFYVQTDKPTFTGMTNLCLPVPYLCASGANARFGKWEPRMEAFQFDRITKPGTFEA